MTNEFVASVISVITVIDNVCKVQRTNIRVERYMVVNRREKVSDRITDHLSDM